MMPVSWFSAAVIIRHRKKGAFSSANFKTSDISNHFSLFKDPPLMLLMLGSTMSSPHSGLLLTFILKLLNWVYVT